MAPNSITLIVGRAIAGIGVGGLFSGAIVILSYCLPLRKRPAAFGLIGSMWGIASVAGPLLGMSKLHKCSFLENRTGMNDTDCVIYN